MAPLLCAWTAFKLASLIERPGAFWSLRPRPPAAALGVVFAGRALLRLVVTAFLPNRARTRSAISSSSSSPLSFSRSASSRASRWEIRCFSCSINAVILVVSPWSADRPPFAVLWYSPMHAVTEIEIENTDAVPPAHPHPIGPAPRRIAPAWFGRPAGYFWGCGLFCVGFIWRRDCDCRSHLPSAHRGPCVTT